MSLQILMRPDVVVPQPKYMQGSLQFANISHCPLIQFLLEGTEEPLYPAVLPGAMRFNALVPNTHEPEGETKEPGPKHGFVVVPKRLGPTKTFNAAGYHMEQDSCRFVRNHCEGEISSRTVIQYAED